MSRAPHTVHLACPRHNGHPYPPEYCSSYTGNVLLGAPPSITAKRYIAHISVNCPVRADVEDPTLVRLTAPHTGHSRDVGRAGGRHWGAARGKRARQSPSDIPESRESVEVTAPPRLGGSAGSALSPPVRMAPPPLPLRPRRPWASSSQHCVHDPPPRRDCRGRRPKLFDRMSTWPSRRQTRVICTIPT